MPRHNLCIGSQETSPVYHRAMHNFTFIKLTSVIFILLFSSVLQEAPKPYVMIVMLYITN